MHSRGSFHGSLRHASVEAPENHEQEQEEQQQVTACCKRMDWTHTYYNYVHSIHPPLAKSVWE